MNMLIEKEDRIAQVPGFLISQMDNETVMMNMENGNYYNLGHTGGRIWELIADPATTCEIVNTLCQEFEINELDCELQVNVFLQHLLQEKLIEIRKD